MWYRHIRVKIYGLTKFSYGTKEKHIKMTLSRLAVPLRPKPVLPIGVNMHMSHKCLHGLVFRIKELIVYHVENLSFGNRKNSMCMSSNGSAINLPPTFSRG